MKRLLVFVPSLVLLACANSPQDSKVAIADTSGQLQQASAVKAEPPPASQQPLRSRLEKDAATRVAPLILSTPQHLNDLAKREVSVAGIARDKTLVAPYAAMPSPSASPMVEQNRERYRAIAANPVRLVAEAPVSTFSIDVDTGSYSNVHRILNAGQLPPADAVRVEELVNYFPYDYAQPTDDKPFAVASELAPAPWNANNVLLRVGIKGKDVAKQSLPPANLVFLVDVSGSMNEPNKLPLLQSSLKLLVNELRAQDRITLVTYAGSTAVVLQPTPGNEKARIAAAIDALTAGGSTAGASGIKLAYQMAQQGFMRGGINRILLATDGDFNVGITDFTQLKSMVEEKRKSGISLSTLGFGTGNYNEENMEQLADVGDGAYSYVDTLMEGHKVLVDEMTSTLATIARDVKIQVEFNPAEVKEYRLIGYENRILNREDFNNDKVDAGDIGAGHTVTALYELTLADGKGPVDALRYQPATMAHGKADELAHIKLRYKQPTAQTSQRIDLAVQRAARRSLAQTDCEFRFAAAVAGFGQLLRGRKYTGQWRYADARQLAATSLGNDRFGYRGEFLRLVDLAQALATKTPGAEQAALQ